LEPIPPIAPLGSILSRLSAINNDPTLAIDIRDITKTYMMGALEVQALAGVTFTIRRGEYVAIMGPSGSGKSTLMNVIGCLDRPSTGTYLLDGVDVSQLDDNALAEIRLKKLGFIFQGFNLLARTDAIKNVALPLFYAGVSGSERKRRALDTLDRVGLGDRASHKPNELSGGQQQRVAIARALINDPTVLLADEPTGNLDSKTSEDVLGLFGDLHEEGRTIVMVTHDENIAMHARRIIRLRDGLVLSDSSVG
jgi:putative ABC transport system ATP-binding protein